MRNVIKNYNTNNITEYSFDSEFAFPDNDFNEPSNDMNDNMMTEEEKVSIIIEQANHQVDVIIENAQYKAKQLIDDAKKHGKEIEESIILDVEQQAQKIKEEAYTQGYNQGLEEGYIAAKNEHEINFRNETAGLLEQLGKDIQAVSDEKELIIKMNHDDLTELVINIASKVINVSLKSSNNIIEKMIIAATEKSKSAQWVKIFISESDAEYVFNCEKRIIDHLKHITDVVKFEILENKDSGTCIVEFPDQIIDASINTQLENIKNLIKGY